MFSESNFQKSLKNTIMKLKKKFNSTMKQFVFIVKTMFLTIFFLSVTNYINADNKEVIIKSKIDKVTVFLSSAQVFRSGTLSINSGTYEIIFEGVSPLINDASIQVNGTGNYTILDVKHRIKQPKVTLPAENIIPIKIIKDINLLEDSLSNIQFEIDDFNSQSDVLKFEKRLIENNKLLTGGSDTIPEIKDGLSYIRTQLLEINKKLLDITKALFKLNQKKNKMQIRLNSLKSYNSQVNPVKVEEPKNQVVVTVFATAQTSGKLEISYIVNDAGWSSSYDIRAESNDKPLKLVQKANIYQNSGEDWKDVNITLSTITPTTNNVKPYLPIMYLSYNVYRNTVTSNVSKYKLEQNRSEVSTASADVAVDENFNMPAQTSANYMQTVQTMTNVEYSIPLVYSIPSDGEYHIVAIQNINLKTDYIYYLTPKVDKQAFLIAKITDFEQYDLLPGTASIFFNGSFVGSTALNTSELSDTIELALGRDRNIIVERKKQKEDTKNVVIGTNQIKTISYEINLKNSKTSSVNLILTDQIPVSNDKNIIVKPLIIKGAELDESTGLLSWKIKLSSNESKTLKLSYSIESDKNKPLANLN